MPTMNVFESDAFSVTSLTAGISKIDYVPQALGAMGIFEPRPITSADMFIDRRSRGVKLIPVSSRGAPPAQREADVRDAIPLKTVRLTKADTITASEIAGIRAFNTENQVEAMQTEVARRLGDLRADMELTHEHHRLGAIQGKVIDADGTTVVKNYFTTFGVTEPSAVDFALTTATTDVRGKCSQIVRTMARAAKGAFTTGTTVHALCGDTFWDNLVKHEDVKETYRYQQGAALRQQTAFGSLEFGGITFHNYRGSDDGSAVAIGANTARFFPVGATGVFLKAMAPADEYIAHVGQRGQDVYARQYADHHDPSVAMGRVVQVDSYPLYICSRPDVLLSAVGNS